MDIQINLETFRHLENSNLKIDSLKLQKMILLYNALEDGWSIKHKDNSYIFTKKHQNKKHCRHTSKKTKPTASVNKRRGCSHQKSA